MGLQSAITVQSLCTTVSAYFTITSLTGLFKLEPFSTSWEYTAHYTVLPAGAKHSTISITAYSQVPIYTPGWKGAKSKEGSAQFLHAVVGARTPDLLVQRRAP